MNMEFKKWFLKCQGALLLACLMLLVVVGAAQAINLPITITANNSTKVYGTPITFVTANTPTPSPDYTVTGSLQAGDTVNAVTLTSDGAPAAAPVSGSPYPIIPSAAVMTITSGNTYTISYVNGSLTVTPTTATLVDPAFRKPILLAQSQAATAWTNVIPNALADYYTYVPFKNADAVALGFPSTCGNPNAVGATAADLASTDDCYTISAKKFQQQLALPGIFGGGAGLINPATGTPYGATTWAFGYGSGGANWVLPYYDTTKPGVVANTPVTGNAPAPFANGTYATTGIWHWPAPTIKGTKGRPVRVQWLNELPNEHVNGFDPTLCGGLPADCFPYNRIVTHVHGAHTGPENDGQVHGWFTPGFAMVGALWESTRQHGPEGTYLYPMDQEAGTIWYHDHATGVTHTNVNMGVAGFFPITDANEKLLQANNILPTGTRDLGFALQDRVFYDDSQMTMSDAPILDPAFAATCTYLPPDPVTGDILVTSAPSTCSPVFMKAPDGHLVPYPAVPGTPAPAAYLAVSSTLEFFGKIPVVNGVSYGSYNVGNIVHRARFLNGSDSRTYALRLKVAGSNPARYLPFWQIAAEQGLLNNPVKTENLLIMPGERIDTLIDFSGREVLDASGVPAGSLPLVGARIIVENWAGDVPYGGEVILPVSNPGAMAFRSADIPEVMAFNVTAGGTDTIVAPSAATALRPTVPAVPNLTLNPPPVGTTVRNVSLVEIVDQWQRIMPTLDGRGFIGYGVSELPKLNTTEQWDIINTTVDAHPIHLHQVAFQLVNRETIASTCLTSPLAPLCVTPASTATAPYTPAVVTAYQANSIVAPLPEEIGYKDTIMCPPGAVTRVIATFDIPGTYVWHCHILSHEEHDMMRAMIITTPAASVTLTASSTSQPTGATMAPVNLTAQAFTGIAAYPLGRGFEYDFTATGPAHAPVPPSLPTRTLAPFSSSLGDAFNVVNVASWTPPTTPGVYTITASTKAMGPVGAGNPVINTAMNYIVGNATVTINPASLTTTYNGTPQAVTILSTTPPGLPVNVTYNGSATPPTTVGSYSVVATISDPTNTYFGTTSATLVINKAPLSIKANNIFKLFGTLFTFAGTEFTANGLFGTDAVSSVTLTSTGAAASATVAGSPYPIVPSAAIGTGLANYTITYINGSMTVYAPLVVTTTTLPGGTVGVFYWKQLAATGGIKPYTWAQTAGTLPPGLTMYPSGIIRLTPTTAGTFNFTVKVTDANGITATQALSIVVAAKPVAITTTTLAGGTVGAFYWKQLAATGGTTPYTWMKTAGTLPTGLTMYPSGVIRGTPTAAGTFNFTVKVTAANGSTATKTLCIIVSTKSVTITTTALADGKVGVFYWKQLAATGGTTPYTWMKTAGTLPTGLTMYPSGVIRLTPTTAGTFSFTVKVTAANGSTATKTLNIKIAP